MASSFNGLVINDNGYLTLPVGSVLQRPTATPGMMRFNNATTANNIEYYDARWNNQDKLVLSLDANDSASYPGTGSIWYDISGNNNHVQLFNSPAYTSGTPAYFTFNGTNNYCRTIKPVDMSYEGYFSVEVSWYNGGAGSVCLWEHTGDWNQFPGGFGMFTNSNGGGNFPGLVHMNSTSGQGARNFPIPSSSNIWLITHQQTASVSDSNGYRAWLDGASAAFDSSQQQNPATFQNQSRKGIGRLDHFYLGCRGNPGNTNPAVPSYFFNGRIATFKVWQSKRTDAQVLASFNSLKARYGL